jgi:hypothetical protein
MNRKIPILLAQAERESNSPAPEKSSVASASRKFRGSPETEEAFHRLKGKLFRIDEWNSESGISSFELFDENGNAAPKKTAAVNDFIKITLPGSGKDDWVKIIEIYDAPGEVVLTVQPSPNPAEKKPDENTTSHFFTADSTNNFCLEKTDEALNFFVIGLSEKANTDDTKNVLETVRNYATANLGHYLGIQMGEWKTFCENFLEAGKSEKGEK